MSVLIASGGSSGLSAATNLSNPQSCTKLVWCKFAAQPSVYNPLLSTYSAGATTYIELYGTTGVSGLNIHSSSASAVFSTSPTWTNWTCYAMTATTAGANSLIGYWQDNSGGGFVSQATTGVNFTVVNDQIACNGNSAAMTMAYYKEWNTVLTPTQLQTEFLAAAPVITGASLRRYQAMTNAASAGTDTSGNAFNMSVVGTLADGSGLPTFATTNPPRRLTRRILSTTYFG